MKSIELNNINENNVMKIARCIADNISDYNLVYLDGPLGSGKTTLVRAIIKSLGYNKRVKSPTYNLIELYSFNNLKIAHIDLYRINCLNDLCELGLEHYYEEYNLVLIEWPKEYLIGTEDKCVKIEIRYTGIIRTYVFKSVHNKLLAALKTI